MFGWDNLQLCGSATCHSLKNYLQNTCAEPSTTGGKNTTPAVDRNAIIYGVIFGVLGVSIVVGLLVWFIKKRKARQYETIKGN